MDYVLVTSARKNPDKNIRTGRLQELEKYYELDKDNKPSQYYVSFTELPKIGINPKFNYGNVIGVYAYPLPYIYRRMVKGTKLFATDREYIQVLKLNTDKILSVDSIREAKYKSDRKKIFSLFNSSNYINESQLSVVVKSQLGMVDELGLLADDDYLDYHKIDSRFISTLAQKISRNLAKETGHKETTVQKLWCLMLVASAALAKGDYTVYWNKLLQKLGYKAVIDYTGLGFIHPNEPYQAVFLTKDAYKHVDTISNKESSGNTKLPRHLYMFIDGDGKPINLPTYEFYVDINKDVAQLSGKNIEITKFINNNFLIINKGSILRSATKKPVLHDFLFCGKYAEKVHFIHCAIQSVMESKSPERASEYYGTRMDNCELTDCFIEIGKYNLCKLTKCNIDYGRFYKCEFKDCSTKLDKNNSLLFKECKWL